MINPKMDLYWLIYNASVSVGLTEGVCKGISEAITVIEQEMSCS